MTNNKQQAKERLEKMLAKATLEEVKKQVFMNYQFLACAETLTDKQYEEMLVIEKMSDMLDEVQ